MKINCKMIAFSDNGECGEKIVAVPLAGPEDRSRNLKKIQFLFSHERCLKLSVSLQFQFFILLSAFSCLFISQHKDPSLGPLRDFPSMPKLSRWTGCLRILPLCVQYKHLQIYTSTKGRICMKTVREVAPRSALEVIMIWRSGNDQKCWVLLLSWYFSTRKCVNDTVCISGAAQSPGKIMHISPMMLLVLLQLLRTNFFSWTCLMYVH